MAIPTSHRVGNLFCMARRRTSTTSPKPLTDKPDHKQTSRKDKQISQGSRPFKTGLIIFVGRDLESGSRIGIYITEPPLPCDVPFISHFKDDRNTSRATDGSLELNLFLYVVITTHRRQPNPAPAQPPSPSPPGPPRRRKPQNPWVLPWILQREEIGCYTTLLDELITSDIPVYRNFTRMEPAFFYLIEERITPHLRKSITNFRQPLEVGLKLKVTLRHLSTGGSYTSQQYHWRVGRSTICKFILQVCKAILMI